MDPQVQKNISLAKYNTFGVDVRAKKFIKIEHESQLEELYAQNIFKEPFFVLGGGSNVLFTKDIDKTIIHIAIKGKEHQTENSHIYVHAGGGEVWNDLVWYCVDNGLPGMENLALIPGTVGASPIQNIGAYGTELMDIFHTCRAFDTQAGKFQTFKHEDCHFSYRDSIFKAKYKNRFIITSVSYKLSYQHSINTEYGKIKEELAHRKIEHPDIKDIAKVVSHIRVEKLPDPSTVGNAGSFFKNPIIEEDTFTELHTKFPDLIFFPVEKHKYKLAAGWLIESCGWKGKTVGAAGVWKNQALVLINANGASGTDIFDLSEQILKDVYNKYGILLEREVNIL